MSLNAYNAAAARHLPQAVVNPASMSQTVRMRQSICRELEGEKPENTQKTQQPKMDEYFQFCRELYPHQTFPEQLTADKIYNFMFYVAFREKKKRGGNRKKDGEHVDFDIDAYNKVIGSLTSSGAEVALENLPKPKEPLSKSTFNSYRACMRVIYNQQKANNQLSQNWDDLWTDHHKSIQEVVYRRQPKHKKE